MGGGGRLRRDSSYQSQVPISPARRGEGYPGYAAGGMELRRRLRSLHGDRQASPRKRLRNPGGAQSFRGRRLWLSREENYREEESKALERVGLPGQVREEARNLGRDEEHLTAASIFCCDLPRSSLSSSSLRTSHTEHLECLLIRVRELMDLIR